MIHRIRAILTTCLLCAGVTKVGASRVLETIPDSIVVTLTPQQTAASLEKEIGSLIGQSDEGSQLKLAYLNGMISAIQANGCSATSFINLNSLIKHIPLETKTGKANIVNLLRHHQQDLFERCKTELEASLSAAVDRLSSQVDKMERAKAITDSVMIISHGDLYYTYSALVEGVKDYLEQEKQVKINLFHGTSMKKFVLEPCLAVNQELGAITDIYRSLKPEMMAQLSNFERDWAIVDHVCRDALNKFS